MQDRYMHTPLLLSAYKTTQSMVASQRHTLNPLCLQDPHEAWSPVRDTHLNPLCLQDPHKAWSLVRDTPLILSAFKTRTKHGHRSDTPLILSAYKIHTKHGHWSETHP